ncbi:MAG: D-alanine--D-alanine ligase [candidate division FCPU426 bacterium]
MKPAPALKIPDAETLRSRLGRRRVAVLMGGRSAEREISLLSGQAVVKALRERGVRALGLDLKRPQDVLRLAALKPAVAVLCLHGPGGEDGKIQGWLEWMEIPHTDSRVLASALAMDKYRAKQVLNQAGIPTAPGVLLARGDRALPRGLRLPLVVKPNAQGSAIGVTIVKTAAALERALAQARRFGDEVLVERFVPGRELSVGVMAGQALPVIEIKPKKEFYDYEAKYVAGMSDHILPAQLPGSWTRRAQALAVASHRALGCRGATRVDLIAGASGRMVVLEVNTIPGMTATSLLPEAARCVGVDFGHLVLWLIADALEGRN